MNLLWITITPDTNWESATGDPSAKYALTLKQQLALQFPKKRRKKYVEEMICE